MSLNGKVAIVTGSSSGIGAAVAIKLVEEGARVAIVGRNQEKLNNVAKKCGNPLVLVADVSKDEDAKRIVDETVKHFGKLDILINNAGILRLARIDAEEAMAVFDKIMSTNVRAAVYITHLAAPYLIKTKGNIVNISSVAAFRPFMDGYFSYGTSKAALDHFTRCIALELAPNGVRANVVNPGPVTTDIFETIGLKDGAEEEFVKQVQKMTALDRVSESEEIADLVLFLVSDKARGITGSSYVSDNGLLLTS